MTVVLKQYVGEQVTLQFYQKYVCVQVLWRYKLPGRGSPEGGPNVFWSLAGPPLLGDPKKLFHQGPYMLLAALVKGWHSPLCSAIPQLSVFFFLPVFPTSSCIPVRSWAMCNTQCPVFPKYKQKKISPILHLKNWQGEGGGRVTVLNVVCMSV